MSNNVITHCITTTFGPIQQALAYGAVNIPGLGERSLQIQATFHREFNAGNADCSLGLSGEDFVFFDENGIDYQQIYTMPASIDFVRMLSEYVNGDEEAFGVPTHPLAPEEFSNYV